MAVIYLRGSDVNIILRDHNPKRLGTSNLLDSLCALTCD